MKLFREKEIRALEAVQSLVEQGCAVHSLTVQQIADAAGVGKGTLYEYFESKEQILAGAALYQVGMLLEDMMRYAQQEDLNFFGKIERFLCSLNRHTAARLATAQRLLAAVPGGRRCSTLAAYGPRLAEYTAQLNGLLEKLVEQGKAEGVIDPAHSVEYCGFCLNAALSHYSAALCMEREDGLALWPMLPENARKRCAMQMLRCALRPQN
ncbi:MAG TPA: TetR/AcrR family transcriptional regulator [Candidatus Anaerofilum faecale]|nr:TetR/AcrR family transcriptional regulator [Candidatus Anaerofilum faecale]